MSIICPSFPSFSFRICKHVGNASAVHLCSRNTLHSPCIFPLISYTLLIHNSDTIVKGSSVYQTLQSQPANQKPKPDPPVVTQLWLEVQSIATSLSPTCLEHTPSPPTTVPQLLRQRLLWFFYHFLGTFFTSMLSGSCISSITFFITSVIFNL